MKLKLILVVATIAVCYGSLKCGNDITTSGISSGGYMAAQFHVANSASVRGSANFAGGIYYCAMGDIMTAMTNCLNLPDNIDVDYFDKTMNLFADRGLIDHTSNLKTSRIFAWTGAKDPVVIPEVGKKWPELMRRYTKNVKQVWDTDCGHSYPTDDFGHDRYEIISPFINNCNYKGAYESLNYLFDGKIQDSHGGLKFSNIYSYDQTKYNKVKDSMGPKGFMYIPTKCQEEGQKCPLHVAFHGCFMTYRHIQIDFITKSHIADIAEKNNIIMMFPNAEISTDKIKNPRGCWDFWGYSDGDVVNYATKDGVQIKAVMSAIKDFQKGKLDLRVASEDIFDMVKCKNKPFYDTSIDFPPLFPVES